MTVSKQVAWYAQELLMLNRDEALDGDEVEEFVNSVLVELDKINGNV